MNQCWICNTKYLELYGEGCQTAVVAQALILLLLLKSSAKFDCSIAVSTKQIKFNITYSYILIIQYS